MSRRSATLATAAIQDIISCGARMSSATIRGDHQKDQQTIRDEAHAHLDAYLDHMAAAGQAALGVLED